MDLSQKHIVCIVDNVYRLFFTLWNTRLTVATKMIRETMVKTNVLDLMVRWRWSDYWCQQGTTVVGSSCLDNVDSTVGGCRRVEIVTCRNSGWMSVQIDHLNIPELVVLCMAEANNDVDKQTTIGHMELSDWLVNTVLVLQVSMSTQKMRVLMEVL